jgi:hypothetical protein
MVARVPYDLGSLASGVVENHAIFREERYAKNALGMLRFYSFRHVRHAFGRCASTTTNQLRQVKRSPCKVTVCNVKK